MVLHVYTCTYVCIHVYTCTHVYTAIPNNITINQYRIIKEFTTWSGVYVFTWQGKGYHFLGIVCHVVEEEFNIV